MSYPTQYVKNQFGETSQNFIFGGTNAIDINFIVDSTNGNGLGIRSLKQTGSGLVSNVYMYTSATPAAGNPVPAAGYILVEFAKGFVGYIGGYSGVASAVSGTPINVTSGVTAGSAYIITSVGTTSAAQWQVLGLPVGITPAVGASFIAIASTTATGTGIVEVPLASSAGISLIDVVGDPNKTCETATGGGGTIICRCLGSAAGVLTMNSYTPAGTITNGTPDTFAGTPAVLTGSVSAAALAIMAPANNTVIGMRFVMTSLPTN